MLRRKLVKKVTLLARKVSGKTSKERAAYDCLAMRRWCVNQRADKVNRVNSGNGSATDQW
jgi:hypothetical protein